jgi:hypothetical protein
MKSSLDGRERKNSTSAICSRRERRSQTLTLGEKISSSILVAMHLSYWLIHEVVFQIPAQVNICRTGLCNLEE